MTRDKAWHRCHYNYPGRFTYTGKSFEIVSQRQVSAIRRVLPVYTRPTRYANYTAGSPAFFIHVKA